MEYVPDFTIALAMLLVLSREALDKIGENRIQDIMTDVINVQRQSGRAGVDRSFPNLQSAML